MDRFYESNNKEKTMSWEDLNRRTFEDFRITKEGSLGTRLICIKQDGSYTDFVKIFLNYFMSLLEMAESAYECHFNRFGTSATSRSDKLSFDDTRGLYGGSPIGEWWESGT